jgi:hypothetical protein
MDIIVKAVLAAIIVSAEIHMLAPLVTTALLEPHRHHHVKLENTSQVLTDLVALHPARLDGIHWPEQQDAHRVLPALTSRALANRAAVAVAVVFTLQQQEVHQLVPRPVL